MAGSKGGTGVTSVLPGNQIQVDPFQIGRAVTFPSPATPAQLLFHGVHLYVHSMVKIAFAGPVSTSATALREVVGRKKFIY